MNKTLDCLLIDSDSRPEIAVFSSTWPFYQNTVIRHSPISSISCHSVIILRLVVSTVESQASRHLYNPICAYIPKRLFERNSLVRLIQRYERWQLAGIIMVTRLPLLPHPKDALLAPPHCSKFCPRPEPYTSLQT